MKWLLELWFDLIAWRVAGGTTGGYVMATLTGNKQKIMLMVWLIVLGVGIGFDKVGEALLSGGIASMGAFIAYGLSELGYHLRQK